MGTVKIRKDLDTSNMNFAEAFFLSETTGMSVVPQRYSLEAKEHVQFYSKNGKFFCQDYDGKAKNVSITQDRQRDKWELSPCNHQQYHTELDSKVKEYVRFKSLLETGISHISYKDLALYIKKFYNIIEELKVVGLLPEDERKSEDVL